MADSPAPVATDGNDPKAVRGSGKAGQRLPELARQVAQAEIPVLDQAVGVVSLDDDLPVLEETFAEFEKIVPVLGERADASDPAPVMPATSRSRETKD